MGKRKQTQNNKLNVYIKEFGSDIFKTDGKILMCIPCEKSISFDQRFQVECKD